MEQKCNCGRPQKVRIIVMNTKIDRDKMFEVCVQYYMDRGCSPELANTIISGTETDGKLKWLYEYILAEWQITGRVIKTPPEEGEEREIDLLAIKPHVVKRVNADF